MNFQRCELLKSEGKIQVAIRIIRRPLVALPPGAVTDAYKGKNVVFELHVILPIGDTAPVDSLARLWK
jgi:hypothetical protein